MPYINERWLGGMLTNFNTIAGRVKKMQEYERMRAAGDFEAMPKKEALILSRELDKLQRNLGGIRNMTRLPDAVFVIDTGLNTLWSGNWIRQSGKQRIIGSFNNGAVGTALGQANGIQALDRSRQVIALCGDGGFNMLMCEFLTAVQHKLPVKAVVYNNSSLGLIVLEAEGIGLPAWKHAIDFTNPDYVMLARACGAVGFKAQKPGELRQAISQALNADGPAIVDCVIAADELPNMPHIDLEKVGNFAKAKVKETILEVTGG